MELQLRNDNYQKVPDVDLGLKAKVCFGLAKKSFRFLAPKNHRFLRFG